LSPRAASFWKSLVPRRCASPERLLLLEAALEALDRADTALEILNRDGLTYTTETMKAVHAHPMLKVEADARRTFVRLWLALGLDHDSDFDPPRDGGEVEESPFAPLHFPRPTAG
jgi:phage terminase small subunit